MEDYCSFTVLDLFSGCGGMAEGFIQAGFNIPYATDYSKEAAETYINRHRQLGYPINFYRGDIRDLSAGDNIREFINNTSIDVIVGGPPCQGFSLTGKRNENDSRNHLFLEYLKIVNLIKPKYFVMENVEGILSYTFNELKGLSGDKYIDKKVPEIIIQEALKVGYKVRYKILNAKDYGVPQNRPRVIFIGHQLSIEGIDIVPSPIFPKRKKEIVTVEQAISDLRFLKQGENSTKYDKRYKLSPYQKNLIEGLTPNFEGNPVASTELKNHQASQHQELTLDRFKRLKEGETIGELLERLNGEERTRLNTKKYRCSKLERNNVSPTILTLPDDIIHYDKNNPRILTVRELARLQSFDDSFEFLGKRTTGGDRRKHETPQYTQVGNAVPPLFAKAVAEEIMKSLKIAHNNLNGNNISSKQVI